MALMHWQKQDTLAVLTMDNAENRMTLDFAHQMLATLDQVEGDKECDALVIASSDGKNWSQGIDTNWLGAKLQQGDTDTAKQFIYGMNEVFKRLLTFPMPVIAAINGHAFGNGAIMACACDFRFMRSERGFFCFPEVDVNIPFLPGMLAIIRKAVPQDKMQEMIFLGKRSAALELAQAKVIMQACPMEELMPTVLAFARTFHKQRGIFGELKRRMHKAAVDCINQEDPPYIDHLKIMA